MSTRVTSVPIYAGDDFEEIARLRRDVTLAEQHADQAREALDAATERGRRFGDAQEFERARVAETESLVEVARAAYNDFVLEAADRATIWVLNSIGHREYRELLKAHPPRKTTTKVIAEDGSEREVDTLVPEDAAFGVNVETFPMALLMFVDPEDDEIRTVAEPEFATELERRRAFKRLAAGEIDSLWVRAMSLNTGMVADPKEQMFSLGTHTSDET